MVGIRWEPNFAANRSSRQSSRRPGEYIGPWEVAQRGLLTESLSPQPLCDDDDSDCISARRTSKFSIRTPTKQKLYL